MLQAKKVAVVTGRSSGIRRATALAFAREGARVVIAARRPQPAFDIVKEIESAGGNAVFVQTDVS
jgi:NAD(P)-dependent dehydrogenase (short-subunit alcohol dehydrogenase family)